MMYLCIIVQYFYPALDMIQFCNLTTSYTEHKNSGFLLPYYSLIILPIPLGTTL